jgi:hypothetical protein
MLYGKKRRHFAIEISYASSLAKRLICGQPSGAGGRCADIAGNAASSPSPSAKAETAEGATGQV